LKRNYICGGTGTKKGRIRTSTSSSAVLVSLPLCLSLVRPYKYATVTGSVTLGHEIPAAAAVMFRASIIHFLEPQGLYKSD
jgi:hypothetical protein